MNMPPLPRAIERDETEHGKLYYTRAQVLAYGEACVDANKKEKDALSAAMNGSYSKAVDDIMGKFGMKS